MLIMEKLCDCSNNQFDLYAHAVIIILICLYSEVNNHAV